MCANHKSRHIKQPKPTMCIYSLIAFALLLSTSCEEARRVSLEPSANQAVDMGDMAGSEAGTVAGMEAGSSAGMMAGDEAGISAGDEAGALAGDEAGALAGMELGGIDIYEPSRLEAQSEILISGLSIVDAWHLGSVNGVDTWILLAEQGLLTWRNVNPEASSIQALPDGVEVQRGELSPIRFDQSQAVLSNTRPLQAFLLSGIPAILFENDLWLAPPSNTSASQLWQRSPLSQYFSSASSALWLEDDEEGGQLWLSHEQGLSQWLSNTETWRTPNVLDSLAQSLIRFGPWVSNNTDALWAWSKADEHLVYAIAEQAKWHDPSWFSSVPPVFVENYVWGLKDGKLYGGEVGQAWADLDHPVLTSIIVDQMWSGAQALWFLADRKLWRYLPSNEEQDLGYTSVEGTWRGGLSDQGTGLYLWGSQGLNRFSIEVVPSWDLSGDQLALDALQANLVNIMPEDINGAWAWLNSEAIDTVGAIDPQNLPAGHVDLQSNDFSIVVDRDWLNENQINNDTAWLVAYVDKGDGEPLLIQRAFSIVQAPTWSDVEILYQISCESCHDGRGGARDLSTAILWEEGIEEIIFVTEMQSMPIGLPPFSEDEVDILRRWRDYGYMQ